jgi:hypothetical protein
MFQTLKMRVFDLSTSCPPSGMQTHSKTCAIINNIRMKVGCGWMRVALVAAAEAEFSFLSLNAQLDFSAAMATYQGFPSKLLLPFHCAEACGTKPYNTKFWRVLYNQAARASQIIFRL